MTPALDLTLPAIDELAALGARFVCWKWETRDGKRTKPPINPHTGGYADTTDPTTWSDLGTAMAAVERYQLDGVGPVLDAERDGIVGTDLDGCRNAGSGDITDWALRIIRSLRSYAEVSPSGTGVKIYSRADPVPKLAANKRSVGRTNGAKPPGVEVYTTGRYFCLTGQLVDGAPDEICDSTEALERLAAWIARAKPAPELPALFLAMLERDASLKDAWENGTKIGSGGDTSASGLDWSLARHLRPHLDNGDLEAVLRCYQHGQIGSGRLKGKAAERRIARILDELGPRPTEAEAPPLATRSMAALADVPVPILRYLAADWIPRAKAVLMAGMGGSGKTTLACQLAAARAASLPFLGLDVDRGVTVALLCEDDWDDAHRMLARLADRFDRKFGDFADFHYFAAAGEDNVLVARLRNGRIVPTKLYQRWQEQLGDLKATLQILDNARHIAAVNENDGVEVTTAWALLHGLGRPTGAATILLGHTPKSGNAEFSGNAAWENVARVRLFLGPVAAELGEEPIENDPRRIFRRGKANANGTARMDLVWEQGAFRLEHPECAGYGDRLASEMRHGQAQQSFLDALARLTAQQRATSHGPATRNFAPRIMKAAKLADDFTIAELTGAMETLFKDGRIKADMALPWRDKGRHVVVGIARC